MRPFKPGANVALRGKVLSDAGVEGYTMVAFMGIGEAKLVRSKALREVLLEDDLDLEPQMQFVDGWSAAIAALETSGDTYLEQAAAWLKGKLAE